MIQPTQNLSLYFVRETPDAVRYCRDKDEDKAGPDEQDNPRYIWLPRSVCTHRLKYPAPPSERPLHVVAVLVWFLNKKGLG